MRALIPLAAGLIVGLAAVYYVMEFVKKSGGPRQTVDTVEVVRATADIGPTIEITEAMVRTVKVPKTLAPKNGFSDIKDVIGRVTSLTIPEGTAVVERCLAPPGTPPGMAVRIRDGYRAVAVNVDESVSVAGWIKPDSRVDVLIRIDMKSQTTSQRKTLTKTLLQDVRVLAVGQDLGGSGEPGAKVSRTVTLEVTPEEAQLLHMTSGRGNLRLAMRNPHDVEQLALAETTTDDVLGTRRRQAREEAADRDARARSLLASIFKTPAEPAAGTDVGSPPSDDIPEPSALTAEDEEWVVELLAGAERSEFRFEDDGKGARRLGGQAASPSANTPAAVRPSPKPAPVEVEEPLEPQEDEIVQQEEDRGG